MMTALVLEDQPRARALLERAVRRAPVDSIPALNRNYEYFLSNAAYAGDSIRAKQWHSEARKSWAEGGNVIVRGAWETHDDAMLALSRGRYEEAAAKLRESDQRLNPRTDVLNGARFIVFSRMNQADSAIAVGEQFLKTPHWSRVSQDVLFRANVLQRLGELYETKGDTTKALERYEAFVDLWKDADPELQPRVRDVRGRIERLRRQQG